MRGDEARLRMLLEEVVALCHQVFERHLTGLVVSPVGEERELEPALVLHVNRLEELLGLGGVDEGWEVEPRERVPDRVELWVVHLEPAAIGLPDSEAKTLGHLADADRARLHIGLELGHGFRAPFRADVAEVDAGEHAEPVLVWAGVDRLN